MDKCDQHSNLLKQLATNPRLAHQLLFQHRHHNVTPDYHYEVIDLWHSTHPRVLIQAFRGAAKSSIAEEAIIVQACFRRFKNAIILGESYDRAVERLRAIKHEFETNEIIEELFGSLVGSTWSEGKIILSNGVIIQAFGRGQSLRGSKHLDWRPDRAFGDDVENEESVASEDAIAKSMRWLMSVVIPALDPSALVRINGTPLHPRSVIMQLAEDPSWVKRVYPIEHVALDGSTVATWPDRFSTAWVATKRQDYARLGLHDHFQQEFMCKAEDPAMKPFTADLFRVEPLVRTWQAVYAMYDPARTVKTTSASTGVAIWSWVNNRLIVWDAYAGMWKPDEIIADMFKVDDTYRPVVIGVEEDGLHEFILQPLRHEQIRRAYSIPIRNLKAPKGKLDFIRGLQPFFKAREVIFAQQLKEAESQFLAFPSGRIDIPNALAYALRLRPGAPLYEGFGVQNISDPLSPVLRRPSHIAVNTDGACTTAALVQVVDGALHVLADEVREGDASALGAMRTSLALTAGQNNIKMFAPPAHFSTYDKLGLRAAVRKIPAEVARGGSELTGREEIRALLGRQTRGFPMFRVSTEARWTLNALAGGYCKEVTKHGVLTEFSNPGPYKVLMEGIESFAALLRSSSIREEEEVHYRYTADGRKYLSSMGGQRGEAHESKA